MLFYLLFPQAFSVFYALKLLIFMVLFIEPLHKKSTFKLGGKFTLFFSRTQS